MERSETEQLGSDGGLPASARRVVLVDDEAGALRDLTPIAAEVGLEVVGTASDGEEALAVCGATDPDLVILDERMPKLAGLAVAERLYDGQRVPSVMCSAFPRSLEDDGAGDGVGVFGFVVKPVVLEQFRASVGVAWFRYCEAMSAERELAALRRRLEERRYVEQAKWRIVERQGVPEGEALRAMQRRARSTRRRLGEVAQALLSGEEELRVEPRRRAGRGPRR